MRILLEERGPFLTAGLTYREIAERLQPPRSEDWVSSRVVEIRQAWAEQVLEVVGDELDDELRARLERCVALPRSGCTLIAAALTMQMRGDPL